jgi:pyruvate,water dikinase
MNRQELAFSSGMTSLDQILGGIRPGDNVVWQVDDLCDYPSIVQPFCRYSSLHNKTLVYFRFAQHPPFIPEDIPAIMHKLDPRQGFEQFISQILSLIEHYGRGVCYVFDCLSGLAVDWYTDRMLGNFFRLACPYLYQYETVAYFVLLRNRHTPLALNAIHQTAQIVIDVLGAHDNLYILPIKVFERSSPTMYMLHRWKGDLFIPVKESAVASRIFSGVPQPWIDFNMDRSDTWRETFLQAQKIQDEDPQGTDHDQKASLMKTQLIKMIITRDESLFPLCERYFALSDLLSIGKRMIGTGLIGGKSVGMLLARKILEASDEKWVNLLETHDSYFVGSDVFYTYVILSDCWWQRHELKDQEDFLEQAEGIRAKLLSGIFPREIMEQFENMLNYFGQAPIIVRSSSLLEDAYGNAFSGKYESVFCVNQGTPEERLSGFLEAVRTVYASAMSREALSYRAHWGLLQRDEQMALLVQRVSGSFHGNLYFPNAAGVAYSFNPFVWNARIDPSRGLIRLVFGLGTRAVERHDDDYTRLVALNEPLLRPEGKYDDIRRYTQRFVDILDLKKNRIVSYPFEKVAATAGDIPLDLFASPEKVSGLTSPRIDPNPSLNFLKLLTATPFLKDMQDMLQTLQEAYKNPVDVEFTLNFPQESDYRINLLQCRPFQFAGEFRKIRPPDDISKDAVILKTCGPIIGQTIVKKIDRIIYVLPSRYSRMSMSDRYSVARMIGNLTKKQGREKNIMLIGPGRWGTRMPALGIPVSFPEIVNVSFLCELVTMHEGLVPDFSFGTHFFNDLVEMDIVYMGLFPKKQGYIMNEDFILNQPNRLSKIVPNAASFTDSIHVCDLDENLSGHTVYIHVDTRKQEGIVYRHDNNRF